MPPPSHRGRWDPVRWNARATLATRRQDQILAAAVCHHCLRLAGHGDRAALFRRTDAFTAHQFFYMVSRDGSTATSSLTSVRRATRTRTAQLDGRHQGRPRREWRLLAAGYVAPAGEPGRRRKTALNIASQDGAPVRIGFGQDPGQAGNSQALIWSGRSVDSA